MKRRGSFTHSDDATQERPNKILKPTIQTQPSLLTIANYPKDAPKTVQLPGARTKKMLDSNDVSKHEVTSSHETKFHSNIKANQDIILKQVPQRHRWLEIIGSKAYRYTLKNLGLNSDNQAIKLNAKNALILEEEEDKENIFHIGSVKNSEYMDLYEYFKIEHPELVKIKDINIVGASKSNGYRLMVLPRLLREKIIRSSIIRILCGDDDIHPFNIIINKTATSVKLIDFEMFGRLHSESAEEFAYCLFWMFIFHHKVAVFNSSFIEEVAMQIHPIVANMDLIKESIKTSIENTIDTMSQIEELRQQMPTELSRVQFVFNKITAARPSYPVIFYNSPIKSSDDIKNIMFTTLDNNFEYLMQLSQNLMNQSFKNTLLINIIQYLDEFRYKPLYNIYLNPLFAQEDSEETVLHLEAHM